MEVIDFGLKDYEETLLLQERLFNRLVSDKKDGKEEQEFLLIGEHPSVITMGRRAKESNLLTSPELLKKRGVGLYHIGRGGDITYHCPGQIILYPIIDLEKHKLGVKEYVSLLEEGVITLLNNYNIIGERIDGATGVWIGKGTFDERKICAIGVKCSRFCTMHGLALNVNSDLSGFSMINPCGFQDKGVTSMEIEYSDGNFSKQELSIEKVKQELVAIILKLLGDRN